MPLAARWTVPVAVTALVVGGGVAASATSDTTPDLPERSAEDLLVAIGEAEPTPFSGTLRTVAELGLPDLGGLAGTGQGAGASATDPTSALTRLLSGENQLRVWVGGDEQQRVSLVDDFSELDVVRDGDVVWVYSSSDDTATRYDLAEAEARLQAGAERFEAENAEDLARLEQELAARPEQVSPYADLTPDELARTLLADADPTTEIAVGDTQVVAGRDAYTLVATPRDEATLVGSVEVAVDAETGLVLQVEVGARDQAAPAYVSGFTDLDLTAPAADVFAFTPAPGTTVVDGLAEAETAAQEAEDAAEDAGKDDEGGAAADATAAPEPIVHGEGWSTVVELQLPADALTAAAEQAPADEATEGSDEQDDAGEELFGDDSEAPEDVDLQALLEQLTTAVDGGRVLSSALVTVLLTDDGRVFLGAVDAATLQSYAG